MFVGKFSVPAEQTRIPPRDPREHSPFHFQRGFSPNLSKSFKTLCSDESACRPIAFLPLHPLNFLTVFSIVRRREVESEAIIFLLFLPPLRNNSSCIIGYRIKWGRASKRFDQLGRTYRRIISEPRPTLVRTWGPSKPKRRQPELKRFCAFPGRSRTRK